MTFDEWIQNWRDAQPDGKLGYYIEEGAREGWDARDSEVETLQASIKELEANIKVLVDTYDAGLEAGESRIAELEQLEESNGELRREMDAQLAKLEAENQRLREALQYIYEGTNQSFIYHKAQAALLGGGE